MKSIERHIHGYILAVIVEDDGTTVTEIMAAPGYESPLPLRPESGLWYSPNIAGRYDEDAARAAAAMQALYLDALHEDEDEDWPSGACCATCKHAPECAGAGYISGPAEANIWCREYTDE